MPFTSKRQARFMFANHPVIAKKMAAGMKTKSNPHPLKNLPASKRVKR